MKTIEYLSSALGVGVGIVGVLISIMVLGLMTTQTDKLLTMIAIILSVGLAVISAELHGIFERLNAIAESKGH